jgi:predicted nucleic acid-binding protein
MRALLRRAADRAIPLAVPGGAVAQAWRGGPRQARLARLLADPDVDVPPLDELAARAVGLLCGRSGHADVVDVHIALHARANGHLVVTSDPDDIHAVDPGLAIVNV